MVKAQNYPRKKTFTADAFIFLTGIAFLAGLTVGLIIG